MGDWRGKNQKIGWGEVQKKKGSNIMRGFFGFLTKDIWLSLAIFFLLGLSITVLSSIAKDLFPVYFIYIVVAIAAFWFFSQLGFEAVSVFSSHLYVFSILLLVINLII